MPRRLRFSEHELDRMLDWEVTVEDVGSALRQSDTVEEYEDGNRLVFGRSVGRPLHLVLWDDEANDVTTVVTVYEPDPVRWDSGFRKRR